MIKILLSTIVTSLATSSVMATDFGRRAFKSTKNLDGYTEIFGEYDRGVFSLEDARVNPHIMQQARTELKEASKKRQAKTISVSVKDKLYEPQPDKLVRHRKVAKATPTRTTNVKSARVKEATSIKATTKVAVTKEAVAKKAVVSEKQAIEKATVKKAVVSEKQAMEKATVKKAVVSEKQAIEKATVKKAVVSEKQAMEKATVKKAVVSEKQAIEKATVAKSARK